MRSYALLTSLALLAACSDDEPESPRPDATVPDAGVLDAWVAPTDAAPRLDADTTCYSPLRLAASDSGSAPQGQGCRCDTAVDREPYCFGQSGSNSGYLLACEGFWQTGRDGNCSPFGEGPAQSCADRGYAERAADGTCGRGYASVAGSYEADGGVRSPACCDSILVTYDECVRGGFEHRSLTIEGDGGYSCPDGRHALGFIAAFEPEGCCER